jgi:hypothetical protein
MTTRAIVHHAGVWYTRGSEPRQNGGRQQAARKMARKMAGRSGKQEYSRASMALALCSPLPHIVE